MICSITTKMTIQSFVLTAVKSREELHLTKKSELMAVTLEVSFQVLVDFQFDLLTSSSQRMLFCIKTSLTCTSLT